MQETATLEATGKAADWTLNVNLGAVSIAADDAAMYYRNLEVSSARSEPYAGGDLSTASML